MPFWLFYFALIALDKSRWKHHVSRPCHLPLTNYFVLLPSQHV